tara:strand:- start:129 stop:242 length:114 start_codon:yes stop_codon:yes gene_type:complete
MNKLKETFEVWSLYYRQEIVWSTIGFIIGFTLGAILL